MAIEIVSFPIKSMVDLSIVFCKRLPGRVIIISPPIPKIQIQDQVLSQEQPESQNMPGITSWEGMKSSKMPRAKWSQLLSQTGRLPLSHLHCSEITSGIQNDKGTYQLVIKHGNGHSPFVDDFPIKNLHLEGIFHCHVWLLEGTNFQDLTKRHPLPERTSCSGRLFFFFPHHCHSSSMDIWLCLNIGNNHESPIPHTHQSIINHLEQEKWPEKMGDFG